MTPKQKAAHLVIDFAGLKLGNYPIDKAKKCALVAVENEVNALNRFADY